MTGSSSDEEDRQTTAGAQAVARCRYHEVCGLDAGENTGEDFCILHSQDLTKDKQAFKEALAAHRGRPRGDFRYVVFPVPVIFSGTKIPARVHFTSATFNDVVDFRGATFGEMAHFLDATFNEHVKFEDATFTEDAKFNSAKFMRRTSFSGAVFEEEADFFGVTFTQEADFSFVTFKRPVRFYGATFRRGADFYGSLFTESANFREAKFKGATFFCTSTYEKSLQAMFSGVEVDFRSVTINPLDAVTFRDVDLRKCRFEGTDLRKVEITGATWAEIPGHFGRQKRDGVFDEICPLQEGEKRPWHHIERVYRELKQNYEDRRDHGRAGEFHYGEKEMRRTNPKTSWGLWLFLTLYRYVSGYGERYGLPLLWSFIVLGLSTLGYLLLGLSP